MSGSAVVAFLELLAREASPVEFEAPVLQARSAGAPPAVIEELEQARAVALRVRALLDRRRRREAELGALFDTASDLALLHDLGSVLEAIVRRARKLLDTDVAYMTLVDEERGDSYMRVTDGSVSARFQTVRLPMGTGLGGLVAQNGTPYASDNYPADARFQHATEIDTAVAEEGLIAILGVPMRLGSRIVGVLFAANRTARPFAREDVALLSSLAAHAAVAIDNARLLEETRAALAELSAANKTSREHADAVERAAEAHDRMAELVLRGGDVDDLATSVAELLGGGLVVFDADGRALVSVRTDRTSGSAAESEGREFTAAVEEVAAVARGLGRTVQRGELWATAVGPAEATQCCLVFAPASPPSDAEVRILERAAVVTALLLLSRRSAAAAEDRVRGELLDDLISGRISDGSDDLDVVHERARRLGVALGQPNTILVLRPPARVRHRVATWAAGQAAEHHGLAADRDGATVLLLPGDDPGALARRVGRDVNASLGASRSESSDTGAGGVTVGAGGPALAPAGVAEAYRTAQRCADALVSLGLGGTSAAPADLGFVGLLMGGGGPDIDGFVATTIGAVLDYDRRRGTVLRQTLESYFSAGASPARAAELLHVHVNTVTQRLERLATLLGEDWQRPERALEIQLALRLHRLLSTQVHGGRAASPDRPTAT
jgi:GAF domain-containing protein/sugar diacid utilization regulator